MRALGSALVLSAALAVTVASRADPASQIWSRAHTTWIWRTPSKRRPARDRLGYLRVGRALALRQAAPVRGAGCPGAFYAVEPRGWVCLDRTATLDGSSRFVRGMRLARPASAPLPFRYALSNGAPMYRRLPSAAEWHRAERWLGKPGSFKPLAWGSRGHAELAETRAVKPDGALPFFLADGGSIRSAKPQGLLRRVIPGGSLMAYTRAFAHDGRTWLLSADGTVVPADRVRPYRVSTFHGTELGRGVRLPVAWIRGHAAPAYLRVKGGGFRAAEPKRCGSGAAVARSRAHERSEARRKRSWPVRTFVALDASVAPVDDHGTRYLATRARDAQGARLWIAERDATLVQRRDKPPWGVGPNEKWLVVSITRGTLVAYVGLEPVFTTLVSPGLGGVPVKGHDPVKWSTTPLGLFHVLYKQRVAMMTPDPKEPRKFWIADVPDIQYFDRPFALHVAYWHENFGEPMSGGCVNLSPEDGKRLFDWTLPHVPKGWGGAIAGGGNLRGTAILIVR
jgi:L,D-transpeptidase catalytic domain